MTQERSRGFADAIRDDESIETYGCALSENPFDLGGELHAVIDIGDARNKA